MPTKIRGVKMNHNARLLTLIKLSIVWLLLLSSQWSAAPAGANDPDDLLVKSFGGGDSFRGDGWVSLGQDSHALAIQPDGKIVVVGDKNDDFWVTRYNADGSRDTFFGENGEFTTFFNLDQDGEIARDVAIQADGNIVVVGASKRDFAWLVFYPAATWTTTLVKLGALPPTLTVT
jgi:uncharacterized delta-60 repeat protein